MKKYKSGLSLIEMVVVVSIIAVMAVVGMAGFKYLQKSLGGQGSDKVISSLIHTSRTIALSKHKYAGIRFQKQGDKQRAFFIAHDSNLPYPPDGKTIPFKILENYSVFTVNADCNDADIVFSSQGKLVRKWVQVFPQDASPRLSSRSIIVTTGSERDEFFVNQYTGTLIIPHQ